MGRKPSYTFKERLLAAELRIKKQAQQHNYHEFKIRHDHRDLKINILRNKLFDSMLARGIKPECLPEV